MATAFVAGAGRLYTYDEDDLLPLDGWEGLEIIIPPVEHQTTLPLEYREESEPTTLALESHEDTEAGS